VFGTLWHVRNTVIFNTKEPFFNWSSYYAMAVIMLAEAVTRKANFKPE
jgi:hypothetical protein